MISKELLSSILEKEILSIEIKDNFVIWVALDSAGSINIYELAHKCKEWATSEGFIILTYGEAYYNVDVHYHSNKSKFGNLAFSDNAQEEPEAIFKACEWILNKKDTK